MGGSDLGGSSPALAVIARAPPSKRLQTFMVAMTKMQWNLKVSFKRSLWFFARPVGPRMSSDGFEILKSKLNELIQFRALYTSSTQKSSRPWNANIS